MLLFHRFFVNFVNFIDFDHFRGFGGGGDHFRFDSFVLRGGEIHQFFMFLVVKTVVSKGVKKWQKVVMVSIVVDFDRKLSRMLTHKLLFFGLE